MCGSHSLRAGRSLVGLLLYAFTAVAAADDHDHRICTSLSIHSDYVFRGVSQTLQKPAVQGSLNADLAQDFYVFLWGSTVDFVADGDPDDGASLEFNVGIGHQKTLSENWSTDVTLVHFFYPGTVAGVDYDSSELMTTLLWRDHIGLTLGYSNDVFASGDEGWFSALSYEFSLPASTSGFIRFGHYDLDRAYAASYSFYDISLERSFGPIQLQLSFHNTAGDADVLFAAENTGPRAVLSLQWDR